ncbi:Smr/MutS family protein [Qipengyuania sp. SS22]|uniref:Smr/MutS family protein n=1 Tax=Qipengyuania sp. SS22 TaxID=2979461 RepID=UPI0021E533DD|nr:Smr/MutS family protein [Qipengyuania sp. SS22]UYH54825.1 Smr/MutS family protein [Qipengyuania sp. SS22]
MSSPRGLSSEEAEAWEKLAATVAPLHPRKPVQPKAIAAPKAPAPPRPAKRAPVPPPRPAPITPPKPVAVQDRGLDSHWDRRLKSGTLQPELTLDLHGHNLDGAYDRLMSGVAQARAIGARTILLVTGKARPVEAADRASRRGAIRAKVLDWLAASSHHSAIAAVRRAHQRHGGDGALYIVLKRER